jgi:CRISPR-associated protein Cas1
MRMEPEGDRPALIPARMLNEFVYCKRLAILEWAEGEWAPSADTVEGTIRHANVDRPGFRVRRAPVRADRTDASGSTGERLQVRSVELADHDLGIIAKIDMVEIDGARVQPIDYKKSKRPHVAAKAWDPERVQLCAQGLVLRAHGYACDSGMLYFIGSNERVHVEFDDELVELTKESIRELRAVASSGTLPPPLEDSPKCPRCSLVSICLPDETRWLTQGGEPPRRLLPASTDRYPLYIQEPGAYVRKSGDLIQVEVEREKRGEVRLEEVSALVVFGRAQISTPLLHELCRRETPIAYLSSGGWLHGVLHGLPHRNIGVRQAQYAAAADPERSARIARQIVRSKLLNCRTLLRRNASAELPPSLIRSIRGEARSVLRADVLDVVRGHEGAGTRAYFQGFRYMLKGAPESLERFDFDTRTRRPPRDRINALLSFTYALLTRELTHVLWTVGLDPYLGYLHAPRYGRPSLALDLMEPFRPLVADSACLTVINNGELTEGDFVERLGAVALTPAGRQRIIQAFERRLAHEITHPVFGYRVSYRRTFEIEARLLARHLTGELPTYQPLVTR